MCLIVFLFCYIEIVIFVGEGVLFKEIFFFLLILYRFIFLFLCVRELEYKFINGVSFINFLVFKIRRMDNGSLILLVLGVMLMFI